MHEEKLLQAGEAFEDQYYKNAEAALLQIRKNIEAGIVSLYLLL